MFLLPGLVITYYVTDTQMPRRYATEIKRYLFARQHPEDGGWGLHIEGLSSVFGTAMNYIVLRILGVSAEDERMVKARGTLHKFGGAIYAPHWAKFWMSVLGVMEWDAVNPVPPELWLLPDWVPISPWRWWIHMRQVFLPMTYVYSKRFTYPLNDLTKSLREELFVEKYETIAFHNHRNTISDRDNYHPKTWILKLIMWVLANIWNPYLRYFALVQRAEDWVWELIRREDENTDYAGLGPVNAPMNMLVCHIHDGEDSYSVRRHIERMDDYMWMKNEGMLMNGTNGVQVWDTSFAILSVVAAGFAKDPQWKPMLTNALSFLDDQQMREDIPDQALCYRQQRKGAWPFSTAVQGYTVSDCTSEGIKACILLQKEQGYQSVVSDERLKDAIDVLLTMQNASGGFSSYEATRGSQYMEYLNAAEVFGRIMIEYDYPECTTAVVTAFSLFQKHFPTYRAEEINKSKAAAVDYIRRAQRPDGSWYGSWGVCFTYAALFATESLESVGESYDNSVHQKRACEFLLSKQMADGGWGESYRSCELKEYIQHEESQVVNTAWACLALMEAGYPDKEPIKKGLQLIMSRQQANGEWLQEAIEGVFNCSWSVYSLNGNIAKLTSLSMISYPNYKFIWPIKALGMYARRFGDDALLL
jgi:lanosterol synthase